MLSYIAVLQCEKLIVFYFSYGPNIAPLCPAQLITSVPICHVNISFPWFLPKTYYLNRRAMLIFPEPN